MFKNASFPTIARFAGVGLGFLFFVVLSRRLEPEGIGQYAFGLAAALLVYSWVSFGLDDLSIRECARLARQNRESRGRRACGIVVWLSSGFISISQILGKQYQQVQPL